MMVENDINSTACSRQAFEVQAAASGVCMFLWKKKLTNGNIGRLKLQYLPILSTYQLRCTQIYYSFLLNHYLAQN